MQRFFIAGAIACLIFTPSLPVSAGSVSSAGQAISTTVANLCGTPSLTSNSIPAYNPLSGSAATGTFVFTNTCILNDAVTLTIDSGSNSTVGTCGNGTVLRRFKDSSTDYIPYCLFSDAGYTTAIDATHSKSITGTGVVQNTTIYITMAAGANVPAGTYNDTIVLTATY